MVVASENLSTTGDTEDTEDRCFTPGVVESY